MGKNSLVKSTSKKKTKTKKKDEEKEITAAQKTAPKKKAAPKAKTAPKKKAAPKAKAAPKKKAAPKAKAAAQKTAPKKMAVPKAKAAPKKMAPAVQAKKAVSKKKTVSVKDLLQKKFGTWKPKKLYTVSPDKQYLKDFTAPPVASGTKEETRRIKKLLLKKFDIAEIKAAGKKIAAKKAAVEKTAAVKAAEPEISTPHVPPDDTDFVDPMDKAMKYFAACLIFLVGLVIGASALNSSNYYLKTGDGALEIWQGKFAPMGKKLLFTLPGVPPPELVKEKYSKKEAFPLIFNHYVEKADTLLEVSGMPDFDNIKSYLNKALSYATTSDMGKIVHDRLNNIDLMILLYKAEVATSRGTLSDLEDAKSYLVQASKLNSDDLKSDMIDQKIESLDQSIATLKAKEALEAAQTEAKPAPLPKE